MSRTIIFAVVMLLSAFGLSQDAIADTPLIQFSWSGGLSSIENVQVRVSDNGHVTVHFKKQKLAVTEYHFSLDKDELAALLSLVRSVSFFDQPKHEPRPPAPDVGTSILTVCIGSKKRALTYGLDEKLSPLDQALWKLIHQAVVTTELKSNDDFYAVLGASSDYLSASKVYSPRLLVEPLKTAIASCQDRQKLEWGLTALAWSVSDYQWLGFVSTQLIDAKKKRRLLLIVVLASHPFFENIPKSHAQILLPLMASILDSYARTKKKIQPKTDQALAVICQFMAAMKYTSGLPILTRFSQAHADSNAGGWAQNAIEQIKAKTKQ